MFYMILEVYKGYAKLTLCSLCLSSEKFWKNPRWLSKEINEDQVALE